ncbi:DNA-binding protein [Burkholderia vietnamiensis]|nr:DNA-binding protein [Burkholderia vietnamiensis]
MPSTFGARLVELREHLGLTQGDLCELTGINRKTQFAYEKGQRYPDAGYLTILLKHGFDVLYMLSGEHPPRFGTVHEDLLCTVLAAVDGELANAKLSLDAGRKAKLVALVYQSGAETGQIDAALVRKVIGLIA